MIQIQHRRGLSSQWTSVNPILAEGELGVETNTLKIKMGDGVTDWQHLPYFTQGAVGPANSITIGTVTSGATSSATITGTAPLQTLNLVLEQGDAGTITVGTTENKLPGTTAEVTNTGDNKNAVFNFKIPRGTTTAVGTTTTVTPGTAAAVTNSGSASDLILDFKVPRGTTTAVGTTTTKLPGTSAEVVNSGTATDLVLDFKVPRGSTLAVGTTTTGSTSSVAAVTNSGTASDLVLDFAIPRGAGVPTGGTTGQILTKNSGTDFDTVWQENYADWTSQVKHNVKAGEALSKGMPVYVTDANGTNMIVGKAGNATEATSSKTMGLLAQDLANNGIGFVITEGLLSGLDTSAASAGNPVWLGTAGTLVYGVANKPVAPAHMVFLGIVTRSHATQGEIWVKVQNGFELGELHDVLLTNPTNGQSITYDSASGLWKNTTPVLNLDGLTDVTLTSPADKQVLQYEASTSQWKNKAATGGVTVSEPAPGSPIDGDGWFYSADGSLFVRYNDGTSTQWVQANVPLAANVEQRYYSPNYLINGGMDVWQRGTTVFSAGGFVGTYAADRWALTQASGVANQTNATQVTTGLNNFKYATRVGRVAGVSNTSHINLTQHIETVNAIPLAGKTVTLSFYARKGANFSSTLNPYIITGTGTDQNAVLTGYTNQAQQNTSVTLNTDWARFTYTVTLPSTTTEIAVIFNYIPTGTAGTNDWYDITGVQFEEGTVATPFRRNTNSVQQELAACQRYYYRVSAVNGGPYSVLQPVMASSAGSGYGVFIFPQPMRVTPITIDYLNLAICSYGLPHTPITSLSYDSNVCSPQSMGVTLGWGAGYSVARSDFLALLANANANAYIGFSAEI